MYNKKFFFLDNKKIFGFWLYLMSDCIIFATLFSVYFVMVHRVSFDLSGKEIFKLPLIFLETIILLFSSFTYGLVLVSVIKKKINNIFLFLFLTFFLGLSFCFLEFYEFFRLIIHGFNPQKSGFFSSFFTLIAMHGIHVFFGLIWILIIFYQTYFIGLSKEVVNRFFCLGLFWHFLDIIWIFIFTFVYLFGAL